MTGRNYCLITSIDRPGFYLITPASEVMHYSYLDATYFLAGKGSKFKAVCLTLPDISFSRGPRFGSRLADPLLKLLVLGFRSPTILMPLQAASHNFPKFIIYKSNVARADPSDSAI